MYVYLVALGILVASIVAIRSYNLVPPTAQCDKLAKTPRLFCSCKAGAKGKDKIGEPGEPGRDCVPVYVEGEGVKCSYDQAVPSNAMRRVTLQSKTLEVSIYVIVFLLSTWVSFVFYRSYRFSYVVILGAMLFVGKTIFSQ